MTGLSCTRPGISDPIFSRLVPGTMMFNLGKSFDPGIANVGRDDTTQMVDVTLGAGVNFFDSADGISGGDAETARGVALKLRRDQAVICSMAGEVGFHLMAGSPFGGEFLTGTLDLDQLASEDDGLSDGVFLHEPRAQTSAVFEAVGVSSATHIVKWLEPAGLSLLERNMHLIYTAILEPRRDPEWRDDRMLDDTHKEALA